MKKEIIDIDEIFHSCKKITDSSLNLYKQKLSILNDRKPIYNFSYLRNVDVIVDKLKDFKPTTRRSYIISVVSLLKCLTELSNKKMYKDLYKKYYSHLTEMNNDLKTNNIKTENEKTNWLEQDEVVDKRNKLEQEIIPKILKKKKVNKDEYDELYNLIILSLFVLNKPRRNQDYLSMNVYKNLSDSDLKSLGDNKENAIDLKNKRFIFNNYKTAGTYKSQIVSINENLMTLLNIYLKFHPLRKVMNGYKLLVDYDGNSLNSSSSMTKKINKIFGNRKISSSMLRKIFLTSKYADLKEQLENDASLMGTSENTINNQYIKED